MSNEMARLVELQGGTPYSVPSVREVALERRDEVATFIDHVAQRKVQVVIFLTGVGVTALFREAEALGRQDELHAALLAVQIVCRGPKPSAVLKRLEIPVALKAAEPHTTTELLQTLSSLELQGRGVAVVHYGERNETLADALSARGVSTLEELCLYEWLLPEDLRPLQTLVREIIERRVSAVVFTSQVQARHLLRVAAEMQLAPELTAALNRETIVASIGPTCTHTLQSYGITPHVVPEHPKMGHLVKALVAYVSRT